MPITRRTAIGFLAAACVSPRAGSCANPRQANAVIAAIEKHHGGRLGVAVLDTGSGARISYRADERFPMCSTFKLWLAAAVLRRVDLGAERPDHLIRYGKSDLPEYAPVTTAHLPTGAMSLEALCAAAVEASDNGAANMLLHHIGGPPAYTAYVRDLGDNVTRLDRTELTLNMFRPGDVHDTTSPNATLHNLNAVLLGDALSQASRARLTAWMVACQTGAKRLRAGLPAHWRIGDKTGTWDGRGFNTSDNDIGIIWPPGRAPILVASYYTGPAVSLDAADAAHAEVARVIALGF